MASIAKLKNNLAAINFLEVIGDSMEATKADIVEYQKGQMLQGINSAGEKIGKYKNKDYARKKYNMNPLAGYGNVDLKLHGPFQMHIKPIFMSTSLVLTSTDEKTEKLLNQYGPKIFGFSPGYRSEYSILYLGPEMTKQIKKKIYGL